MLKQNPKKTIINILLSLGEATTEEIINKASKERGCKDRVPTTLISLVKEKLVIRRISKEKKGFVWTLA